MKSKKGQISIFLILGIVILITTSIVFVFYNETISDQIKPEVEETTELVFQTENYKNFLNTCLKNIAEDSLIFIGQRGGYYNLPKPNYNDSFIKTAYYFYEDRSYMPTLEQMQNSISNYINSEISNCFNELNNFNEITNLNYNIEDINTLIIKDSVIVEAQIPTKITVNDATYEIEKYRTTINSRLKDIYNFTSFFIDNQLEDKYTICLSCIINKAIENDLFTDIENIGNNIYIFTVLYNDTVKDSFYKFIFANKYKEFSCNNLPIDADELFLENFLKNCLEKQIEEFNYSLRVENIENLNAFVDVPFITIINASGTNLTFIDYTDLFDIEEKTGIISFTPKEDQVGDHIVFLIIKDSFGNREFININMSISKNEENN